MGPAPPSKNNLAHSPRYEVNRVTTLSTRCLANVDFPWSSVGLKMLSWVQGRMPKGTPTRTRRSSRRSSESLTQPGPQDQSTTQEQQPEIALEEADNLESVPEEAGMDVEGAGEPVLQAAEGGGEEPQEEAGEGMEAELAGGADDDDNEAAEGAPEEEEGEEEPDDAEPAAPEPQAERRTSRKQTMRPGD